MNLPIWFLVLGCFMIHTNAQENTQNQVATSLQECYRESELLDRRNRLPEDINTIIELIRKIENNVSFAMDMRQLSESIVHRFKQDGIQRAKDGVEKAGLIIYSPKGFQFKKHKFLMRYLIPGNALQFNNDSLTTLERCSFHFLLSNTHQKELVESGFPECRKSKYVARYRRSNSVEVFDPNLPNDINEKSSKMVMENNPDDDVDTFNTEIDINVDEECIYEGGVVYTEWGTVSIGSVISGIAAGLAPQKMTREQMGKLSRFQSKNTLIDNKWAATISGDLTEVSLSQGEQVVLDKIKTMKVGASGNWNHSEPYKGYYLYPNKNLEFTEAEILGDIDGLILGSNIQKWVSENPNLKLSQVLDMYYSSKGVYENKFRACNRHSLYSEYATATDIIEQTQAFTEVSEPQVLLQITVNETILSSWTSKAVNALTIAIGTGSQPPTCSIGESQNELNDIYVATDLVIAIDHDWEYKDIETILTQIINKIMVHSQSDLTIISAVDGSIIINTTNSKLDFYSQFNESLYNNLRKNIKYNLPVAMQQIKYRILDKMEFEKKANAIEGQSQIALFIINSREGFALDAVRKQIDEIDLKEPDVNFLYASNDDKERFSTIAKDAHKDTFLLQDLHPKSKDVDSIVKRIKTIPRRLANPNCGKDWKKSDDGNHQLIQHINTGMKTTYKLSPNYFYKSGLYVIKIQINTVPAALEVCYTRVMENPSNVQYGTDMGKKCEMIRSGSKQIMLTDPCSDASYIHTCEPLYVTIKAEDTPNSKSFCNDKRCRFPDDIRYTIHTENLVCENSGSLIRLSLFTLIFSLIIKYLM